jgi:RND superfamily putative drug exporter
VNNPESKRADEAIAKHLPGATADTEIIVVRSSKGTVDDTAMKTAVQGLQREILALGAEDVTGALTYYDVVNAEGAEAAETLVSADRRTTIIPVTLSGDGADADQHVQPVYDLVTAAATELAPAGLTLAITGNATWELEAQPVASSDLKRGELIGIPIALVVLVFVFGALVAAGVPFALSLASIIVALAIISLLGQVFSLSVFATNVVTMLGLAVGIDYTLFIMSRFREERAAGLSVIDAVGRSAATASRAVLFSGITVVLALTGMLMIPFSIFVSMGVGMIIVVLGAVVAALTLLPALLALLGDRVNALPVPFRRPRVASAMTGPWGRMARALMRRPVLPLLLGAAILVALAIPALGLERGESGAADLPEGLLARQGYDMLSEDFSAGLVSPLLLALEGDQQNPQVQAAIGRLGEAASADGRFQVTGYKTSAAGDFGLLELALVGEATGPSAESQTVADLRTVIVPEAVADAPLTVLVGGGPAQFADMLKIVDSMTPVVFAVVLSLSFVLLLLVFRSLVIAVTAVLMNLLSVGASYGLLTLVFQHGIGAGLFGFQQTPRITTWVPLLLFCVLFGLSMDYQVFLLSRVREHYDRTGDTREAVVFGISSTAGIITGAALIMVAVFGGMASGQLVMFQQIGFGLGVAIALDATVVRILVMPSTMAVLGRWNWYLPRWLAWLPGVSLETSATSTQATVDLASARIRE